MAKNKKPYWDTPESKQEFNRNFWGGMTFAAIAGLLSHNDDTLSRYFGTAHNFIEQRTSTTSSVPQSPNPLLENIILTDNQCIIKIKPPQPGS